MLRTSDLQYDLPQRAIATHPASPRDSARLMIVPRNAGDPRHARFSDFGSILRPGDLLVLNATRVVPARLVGIRSDTGGKVDGLWLAEDEGGLWRVMIKARRARPGAVITLFGPDDQPSGVELELIERTGGEGEDSAWLARPSGPGSTPSNAVPLLERIGRTPLPPYIRAARKQSGEEPTAATDALEREDRREYQTVYARPESSGSVAAPTAGLHFTPQLLDALRAAGVHTTEVVLHVGTGTFKPVETEFVEQHPMHAEWCAIPAAACRAITDCRARAGRIVAVGTTSARTLESFSTEEILAAASGSHAALAKWTRILITPGHRFRNIDALITNFHLPGSTLLALVAAFLGDSATASGVDRIRALYAEALREHYRFYSYGDAMVIT